MGKSQEIVARITVANSYADKQKELCKEWHKYNQYIKNGGEPQRIDKHCKKNQSTFQPLVIVHRRDFTNPHLMKQLIGWRDMPIKNFDIVQTTNLTIGLELFIAAEGSFLYPGTNSYTQITTAGAFKLTEKDMVHIINNSSDKVQRGVLIGSMIPYESIYLTDKKLIENDSELIKARQINRGLYYPHSVIKG